MPTPECLPMNWDEGITLRGLRHGRTVGVDAPFLAKNDHLNGSFQKKIESNLSGALVQLLISFDISHIVRPYNYL